MSKVAHYLQEHLNGEVMASPDMRRYFATDSSVFTVVPSLVVYPRNENDVRKAARFTWQLAERGRVIPITARGSGTSQSGGALGGGIVMVFPAHMNRIVELDSKSGVVVVEPGINYGKLQQTLHTHGRYLPVYPASLEYSTLGGAVANNAGGEKSIKYGSTRQYVKGLRVVLANGEVIETHRLSKREAGKKLGLASFEGEIYRALDKLFEEHPELVKDANPISVPQNGAGYDIWDVKRKDGSVDLTPLFVGSEGTLGIVTEVTMTTEVYNPQTTLIAAYFDDLRSAEQAVTELRDLPDSPSTLELVDGALLQFVHQQNPNQLKGLVDQPFPKLALLVEFDSANDRLQKRMTKKAEKILQKYEIPYRVERDTAKREALWKLRHSAAGVLAHADGNQRALPIIGDGVVPVEQLHEYIEAVYAMFQKYGLRPAVWGHAGSGNLHMRPLLDLGQVGDRQKVFRLIDEYYRLVISMGGSTTGEHGDGRLRAPYLQLLYGNDIYQVFQKVKAIFDPYGTLNPGVKVNVGLDDIKPLLRASYSLEHLYDHLPRS